MNVENLTKREFEKLRTIFEKSLLKAVARQLKGRVWRKAQNVIFCEKNDFYYSVSIGAYRNDEKTKLTFSIKPMNIDPIFWEIMKMPENEKESLSFRTWGAFTCSEIPTEEKLILDRSTDEQSLAEEVLGWADELLEDYDKHSSEQKFSSLIKSHENQVQRGAYSISLVASLIAEGDFDEARMLANSYGSDELQSGFDMTSEGRSFHSHAVDWIDDNRSV